MTKRNLLERTRIFATAPAYARFLRDLAKEVVRGRRAPSGDALRLGGLQRRWSDAVRALAA